MELLYWLEQHRTPFFDKLFYGITILGEETFFLVIALCIFWCLNKKTGYFLLTVGFFGLVANQFLKILFKVPRPWIIDPDFTIVELAREAATGFSFPSGHTQNAVCVFGCLLADMNSLAASGKNIKRALCVAAVVLVGASRMYLGVHTPADVLASVLISTLIIVAFKLIFTKFGLYPEKFIYVLACMIAVSAAFAAFVLGLDSADAIELANIASTRTHAWYILGAVVGVAAAYPIEKNHIDFQTKASLPAQILKLVLGFSLIMLLKTLLKQPLLTLFGGNELAHALRYFIVSFTATAVWPLSFGYISRICRCPQKSK